MLRCGVKRFAALEGVVLPDLLLPTLLVDLALARPVVLGRLRPAASSCSASPTCALSDASAQIDGLYAQQCSLQHYCSQVMSCATT